MPSSPLTATEAALVRAFILANTMAQVVKWINMITVLCFLVCLYTCACETQRTEGDYCTLRTGERGICRHLHECPSAIAVLKVQRPIICSFEGVSTIVCCGDTKNNQTPFTIERQPEENEEIDKPHVFDISSTAHSNEPFVNNNWNPPGKPSAFTNKPYKPSTPVEVYEPTDKETDSFAGPADQRPVAEKPRIPRPIVGLESERMPTEAVNRPVASVRKSKLKCKEYSASVTHTVEVLPLLVQSKPLSFEVPRCDISKLPLIVGGEETTAGEFPHMAALGFQHGREISWNCGGSLISDEYVMTAAHCTISRNGPPVVVRLGELNLKSDKDGAQPQDYTISSIIRHPDYKSPSKYHDIALLRLGHRVEFNKFIRPACLFDDNIFPANKTIATGWGQIDYAEKPSEHLLKVALDIIDNGLCNRLYRSSKGTQNLSNGILPSMICAGVLRGGKDTCHGDSGGPIQITSTENKCVYYVIGVTSFGKFCAAENAPGVYTRVSHYLPWIESIVWP